MPSEEPPLFLFLIIQTQTSGRPVHEGYPQQSKRGPGHRQSRHADAEGEGEAQAQGEVQPQM